MIFGDDQGVRFSQAAVLWSSACLGLSACAASDRAQIYTIDDLLGGADFAFVLFVNDSNQVIRAGSTLDARSEASQVERYPLGDGEHLVLVGMSFADLRPTEFPVKIVEDPGQIELRLDSEAIDCSAEHYLDEDGIIDLPIPEAVSLVSITGDDPAPAPVSRDAAHFLGTARIRATVEGTTCALEPLGKAEPFAAEVRVFAPDFVPPPHDTLPGLQAYDFGIIKRLSKDRLLLVGRGLFLIDRGGTVTGTGADSMYPDLDCPESVGARTVDVAIDPIDPTRLVGLGYNNDPGGFIWELRLGDQGISCLSTEHFQGAFLNAFTMLPDGRIFILGDSGFFATQDTRFGEFRIQPKPSEGNLRQLIVTGLERTPYAIGTGNGEVLLGSPETSWEASQLVGELSENDVEGLAAVPTESGIELWASRGQALAELFRLRAGATEWERLETTTDGFGECITSADECGHRTPKSGAKRIHAVAHDGGTAILFNLNTCSAPIAFDPVSGCLVPAVSGTGPPRVSDVQGILALNAYADALYFGGHNGALYEVRR